MKEYYFQKILELLHTASDLQVERLYYFIQEYLS